MEKLAANLGANIHFVGSQTQVREIYALSDLIISATSIKPETFGRTIAESLAMNTPVIATAHGGALDIITKGENGLFFEPRNHQELASQIATALDHQFLNMRNHIEQNFSLNYMTEQELLVYKELL